MMRCIYQRVAFCCCCFPEQQQNKINGTNDSFPTRLPFPCQASRRNMTGAQNRFKLMYNKLVSDEWDEACVRGLKFPSYKQAKSSTAWCPNTQQVFNKRWKEPRWSTTFTVCKSTTPHYPIIQLESQNSWRKRRRIPPGKTETRWWKGSDAGCCSVQVVYKRSSLGTNMEYSDAPVSLVPLGVACPFVQ